MILARFFRPRWQHSNPQVRRQAVVRLSPQDPQARDILRRLAVDDAEAEVRKAAVKRVDDLAFLRERAEQDDNAGVREVAAARYRQLLAGGTEVASLSERLTELDACAGNDVVLGYVARRAREAELRLAAMERLQAGSILEEIALHDAVPRIRQAAALRLTDAASLERVMRHSREQDRRVARIAREALERLQREQVIAEQTHAERLLICEALEALAASAPTDSAERQRLENRWNAVAVAAEPLLEQRFAAALAQCQLCAAEQPPAAVELPAVVVTAPKVDAAKLTVLVTALQQDAQPDPARLEQARQLLAAAAESEQDPNELQQLALLQNYLPVAKRYLEHEEQIQAALAALRDATEERRIARAAQRLQSLLDSIQWRLDLPVPSLLNDAAAVLAEAAQRSEQAAALRQRQRAELEQVLAELEGSLGDGRLKESQRLLAQAQKLAGQLPPPERDRLDRRLKRDAGRVRELQDWRRFATLPKQMELCEQMEALVAADLPPPALAERIHQLQEQWKATGGSASPEAQQLWERFRAAGDQAFDRCRGYFDEQAQRRQENLQQRQKITDQLAQFVAAANWPQLELSGLEAIRAQARAEWLAAVPVDRRAAKAIETQFESLMDTLTARIRERQQANRERKEALVAQVKELAAADDAWAAAEQAKVLQGEWRSIGQAQPNVDRRLWREFRAGCDLIFAHRDAARSDLDQERDARLQRARAICDEAEALAADETAALADIEAGLAALREEYLGLRPLPREQAAACSRRLREAEQLASTRRQRKSHARAQRAWEAGRARLQLCAELEQAVLAGTTESVDSWQSRWGALDAAPEELRARLEERWHRAVAASTPEAAFTEAELAANLEKRRDLCLWMEILAGIESPPEERTRRMDLQVRRLADGMTAGRQQSIAEQAAAVEADWFATGPAAPAAQTEALQARFDAARTQLG